MAGINVMLKKIVGKNRFSSSLRTAVKQSYKVSLFLFVADDELLSLKMRKKCNFENLATILRFVKITAKISFL